MLQQRDRAQLEQDELRRQIESLQSHLTTVEQLKRDLRDAHTEVERLSAELDESKSRVLVLQAAEATTRALTDEPEAMNKQRMQLEIESRDAQARLESESGHSDRIANLARELDASRHDRNKLDAEKRELTCQLDRLRGEKSEVEHLLEKAQERHRQAFEQWKVERDALAEETERQLSQERTKSEAELRTWMDRFESIESQAAKERVEFSEQNEQLRRMAEVATLALGAARQQTEALEQERHRLATRCSDIEAQGAEAERGYKAELARHSEQLEQARLGESSALGQIVELNTRVEDLQGALEHSRDQAEANRKDWQSELDSMRRQYDLDLDRLREGLDELRRSAEQSWNERNVALQQAASLGRDRDELTLLLEKIELETSEKMQLYRAEMAKLSEELERAREQLGSALQENDRLDEMFKQLEAEQKELRQTQTAQRQMYARESAKLREQLESRAVAVRSRYSNLS